MKVFYGTITDINYLVRALCLYRSLSAFLDDKVFGFYCLDDTSVRILEGLALPSSMVVPIAEIETSELRQARRNRAMNEYCWTCKPAILEDAIGRVGDVDWAVYLDSDMMAFSDPDMALAPEGVNAVITPHRFSSREFAAFETDVGAFNGGCVAFRNSDVGKQALEWWKDRCMEQCSNVPINGTYADQRYLNDLPKLFVGVDESQHIGLNAAPWNIQSYRVSQNGARVCLDDVELLLYHFQGLRIHGTRLYDLYPGNMKLGRAVRRLIYLPYIEQLRKTFAYLRAECEGFQFGIDPIMARPRRVLTQAKRFFLGLNNLALT